MVSFILNSPYTFIGLILAIISIPKELGFKTRPYTFIFKVSKLWWTFSYFKNARALTFGQVMILGPKIENGDLEHELIHIEQYEREPLLHPFLYFLELIKKGYRNNKYEIEAYSKAQNIYRE